MRSEVVTDGEIGIDDFATSPTDAPRVGAVATQRVDAARVWTATRDSVEHADVVAPGLSACWGVGERGSEEPPRKRWGGVYRGASADDHPTTPAVVEVVLRNGHVVRVPAGADADTLNQVFQALQSAC